MLAIERLSTTTVVDTANDDFAIRQRLNSFKLGKVMPLSLSPEAPGSANQGHRHRRSHSRNVSISSTSSQAPSLPSSRSSGPNDLSSFSFGSLSSSSSVSTLSSSESTPSSLSNPGLAPPASKRNSHHRRRSSVSTRRESAELMGVSLPDMPSVSMEDNVNLGEKDSIRRRALWALEGKPDVSFSKVEIPELGTPDMEKMLFDFSTKPTLSGGLSTGFGNSVLGGKRDSFKLLPPSGSSKDQLHTLLEEEEEEEEASETQDKKDPQDSLPSPTTSDEEGGFPPVTGSTVTTAKPSPSRPRPATLHLRPLSLTPDNVGSTGLPTPSLTPSPRSGLRSLSLNPAQVAEDSTMAEAKRDPTSRRPVLNLHTDSPSDLSANDCDRKVQRRSSISYRRSSSQSSFGLPTPEMTPTFGRRCSVSESIRSSKSGDEEFFPAQPSYRPLSASEQHFLFKSHNALLARITDLEKVLSMRRMSIGGYSISGGSRPSSVISDASLPSDLGSPASSVTTEPSDEMLALIKDLKAERDELKKDVDGWRTRVADLDQQLVLVAKRVENERKEAWVARSRVGLLESEKAAMDTRLAAVDQAIAGLEGEKATLKNENASLRRENEEKRQRIQELERELKATQEKLELQRKQNPEVSGSSDEFDPMTTPTPQSFDQQDPWKQSLWKKGLGLDSSLGDNDQHFHFGLPSSPVQTAAEEEDTEDQTGLAGYEDEDECDYDLETCSSPGSLSGHCQRKPGHVLTDVPKPETKSLRPGHRPSRSLSQAWSFPKATASPLGNEREDKFFGCLDDSDTSDESGPVTPMPFNYEDSKDLFASALKFADEGDAPFYIPGGVGVVVEAAMPSPVVKNQRTLGALTEEEEDGEDQDVLSDIEDDEMFGEIGGIRIIFTPPDEAEEVKEVEQIKLATPPKAVSSPPTLPAFDFGHKDDEQVDINAFMFGHAQPSDTPESSMVTPPSPVPRTVAPRALSPSSAIPRPASRSSATSSPPQKVISPCVTPPTKRGGVTPSFIPQPVSSPSPSRIAVSKPKFAVSGPTFIRHPQKRPTNPRAPSSPKTTSSKPPTAFANEEDPTKVTVHRSPKHHFEATTSNQRFSGHCSASATNMKSVDLRHSLKDLPAPCTSHSTPEPSTSALIPTVSSLLPTPISSKLSFSAFSTFMPLSWSARPPVEVAPLVVPQVARTTAFVSRQRQLLKLQRRIQAEGTAKAPSLPCRRCDVRTVVEL